MKKLRNGFFMLSSVNGQHSFHVNRSCMLTIYCSRCKNKLWKYKKIGPGQVLRCHKKRIIQIYSCYFEDQGAWCKCGQRIAIDKGSFYKMIKKSFTCTGTKDKK